MKKIYKILIYITLFEYIILSSLKKLNITFNSPIISEIGPILAFSPILFLLYLLSKDDNISKNKQIIAKCFFWFIICCYILGFILKRIV